MPSRWNVLRFLTQSEPASPPSGQVAHWWSNALVPRPHVKFPAGNSKVLPYEFFYNVQDYGIAGSLGFDSAPAIQACLDLAANGGTVYIPPGDYRIDSELEIKGPCHLLAAPGARIIRGQSTMQYLLKNFNPSYAPTVYNGRGNITVEGGVWDADGANISTSCTVMVFAHADGVSVRNVTVMNVPDWHALEFNACRSVVVENCNFRGFRIVNSAREMSEAIQLDLATSSAALPGIGAGAYDDTPCTDVLVTGCYVGPSDLYGSYGKLMGSHNARNGLPSENIRISSCLAENCNDYGISAYNWQNVVISDNQFVNCNGGIKVELPSGMTTDIERFTVTNNQFIGSGTINNGAAVENSVMETIMAGTGVVRSASFNNNNIKNFANPYGIAFDATSDAVIQGNTVRNGTHASSVGIQVNNSAFGTYSGNKLDSLLDCAMRFQNSASDSAVCGNTINTPSHGIVADSARLALSGNTMRITSAAKNAIQVTASALGSAIIGNMIYNSGSGSSTVAGIDIAAGISIGIQGNMIIGYGTTEGTTGTIRRGGTLNPNMATTQGTQNVNVYTNS